MSLLCSFLVVLDFVVFLFNYVLSDSRAVSKLSILKAPQESDLCHIVIRSESEKEYIEEKYGIKLQHGAGRAYYFPCFESKFYSRPLISNELSPKEQIEKVESHNKEYISKIAEDPSVVEVMYGEYPIKMIPLDYVKPSKSQTSKLWHLSDNFGSDFSNIDSGSNIDVESVWEEGLSGEGITILIVDDGLYTSHIDFQNRIDSKLNINFCLNGNSDPSDPSPAVSENSHGTAVAGVAAGGMSDGICAIGPSYEATIAGRNFLCYPYITFDRVTESLECEGCHVINNSWGESLCDVNSKTCAYDSGISGIEEHLKKYTTEFRDGYGSIYLFSSGNYGDIGEYSNMHFFARSVYTLTVGAIEASGVSSYYSDPGPSLDISAPSNGYGTDGRIVNIYTTGISGVSDCNSEFGGTSSSCPLVSGIVGLMLQQNPKLSYRDIRYLFAHYAKNIDLPGSDLSRLSGSKNSDWISNGYGIRHNIYYGFGQADAELLVGASKDWKHVGDLSVFTTMDYSLVDENGNHSDGTVDNSHKVVVAVFEITEEMLKTKTNIPQYVETVSVELDLSFYSRVEYGNMTITIISPANTRSVVMRRYNSLEYLENRSTYTFPSVEFTSHQFFGESSLGTWKVEVQFYSTSSLNAELDSFSMNFYGVRNEITILSPTYDSILYNGCYGITIGAYPSSSLSKFDENYDMYLLAMTEEYTTSKPISPASTWSIINKLELIPDSEKSEEDVELLSFLLPQDVKNQNYEKYRFMIVEKTMADPTISDILGSYEKVARSPVFKFTSTEEGSICDIPSREVEITTTISADEVSETNNQGSGCIFVDGTYVGNYEFRTISEQGIGINFNATIVVSAEEFENAQSTFSCERIVYEPDSTETCVIGGCSEPLGITCSGGSDISVIQQFNYNAFDPKFKKFVIYTGDNKDSKYSFNLLEFDITQFMIEGDFSEIKISNATIEMLVVNGNSLLSDGITYNNLEITNSSIDTILADNLNSLVISYSHVGNMEYLGNELSLTTYRLQKPYGVNATINYSGSLKVNGELRPDSDSGYELSNSDLPEGTPLGTWNLTVEDVDIVALN